MPKPPRKLAEIHEERRAKKDLDAIPDVDPVRVATNPDGSTRRVFKNLRQVRQWADKTERPVRTKGVTPDLTVIEATDTERAALRADEERRSALAAEQKARVEQKLKIQEARQKAAEERANRARSDAIRRNHESRGSEGP